MATLRRFLLYFAQEHLEFRYPEIRSLIKFFNLDIKLPSFGDKPYWILEDVAESDLRKIASRSVSLRFIVEVWSSGTTYAAFHEQLKMHQLDWQFTTSESSFRITIETFNKHIKHDEKIQRIESMDYLPLKGRIELSNPDNNLIYFEYWGGDPQNVPTVPDEIVFGRWVRNEIVDASNAIMNFVLVAR